MTVEYEPFPLSAEMLKTFKMIGNIPTDEEATRPSVVRKFFDDIAASTMPVPEVEKQDLDIEMNNIKVNISILRPVGTKDKVLPTILFL
jgi:HSP20 family molecular chaperone IbpA